MLLEFAVAAIRNGLAADALRLLEAHVLVENRAFRGSDRLAAGAFGSRAPFSSLNQLRTISKYSEVVQGLRLLVAHACRMVLESMTSKKAKRLRFRPEFRAHYSQELYSCMAVGDFVRFLAWLGAGVLVQWFVIRLTSHDASPVTDKYHHPVWWFVCFEMGAAFVSMTIKNWWLLSLSMGALSYLLIRNWTLGRDWSLCEHDGYLQFAYITTQTCAAVIGPCMVWWLTWTSQAMDRVVEGGESDGNFFSFCFGFGRRHQHHHGKFGFSGSRGCPALGVRTEADSDSDSDVHFFYRDDGCCHLKLKERQDFDSDSSDGSVPFVYTMTMNYNISCDCLEVGYESGMDEMVSTSATSPPLLAGTTPPPSTTRTHDSQIGM